MKHYAEGQGKVKGWRRGTPQLSGHQGNSTKDVGVTLGGPRCSSKDRREVKEKWSVCKGPGRTRENRYERSKENTCSCAQGAGSDVEGDKG